MSGWIINIDGTRPKNWEVAKQHLLWASRRRFAVRAGDDLFFWKTRGGGLVAHAVAAEDAHPVTTAEGVPWPDHREQHYVSKFGLTEIAETNKPLTTSWPQLQEWGEFTNPALQTFFELKNPSGVDRLRQLMAERTMTDIPPTIRNQVELERSQLHSTEDARQFVQRAVAQRRGQPQFRQRLIEAYGGRCCITSYDGVPALEAAHIAPYRGEHTNQLWNGLLLRADIHTLLDLLELTVDASTRQVRLSAGLRDSRYGRLHGRQIAEPGSKEAEPADSVLRLHNQAFALRNGRSDA